MNDKITILELILELLAMAPNAEAKRRIIEKYDNILEISIEYLKLGIEKKVITCKEQ